MIDPATAQMVKEGASDMANIPFEAAKTLTAITDLNKRRRFEQAIALMNSRQQADLNEKLLAAQSQTERLTILSNSVVEFAIANENKSARQEVTLYIVAGVLGLVLIGGAIIYSVKMNK